MDGTNYQETRKVCFPTTKVGLQNLGRKSLEEKLRKYANRAKARFSMEILHLKKNLITTCTRTEKYCFYLCKLFFNILKTRLYKKLFIKVGLLSS